VTIPADPFARDPSANANFNPEGERAMHTTVRSASVRVAGVLATAVAATLAAPALAQSEFNVSTAGATALGAFTRGNANSGTGAAAPTAATINRGPLAIGTSFTLGNTSYAVPAAGAGYFGQAVLGSPNTGEPANNRDRIRYHYLESGSVEGILSLVDSNALNANNPTPIRPLNPQANLALWINGNRYTSANSTGEFTSNRAVGQNYPTPQTFNAFGSDWAGQDFVRIAWSDVRFEQAFAVNGTASVNRGPTTPGYGRGNGKIGNTDFQSLRDETAILGGINPTTTRLRNESVAVVPFNLVANPGTGLARVRKEEAAFLQATGRLPNGANFNSVTRNIGSGTRNQGALNLGIDPSFGGGERDRRAIATFNTLDNNGAAVTVNPGDEADPLRSLTGSTSQNRNENRVGPQVRFSDKISGSSGVRVTVAGSRMAVGILSSGDSQSSDGNALAAAQSTATSPLRALAINFNNGFGYTQATAENITEGRYGLWSASQAITVAPYDNPTANDSGANAYKPIAGDTNDQSLGSPTSSTQVGVHRKYLNNLTGSLSTLNFGTAAVTPADFIVSASFIPTQIMGTTKGFDGTAQSPRTRSTVDPDGPGPLASEQELWQQTIGNSNGTLRQRTAWADPSAMNGGLDIGAVRYNVFASANNASTAVANRSITVNARTNLAGDFNNDAVRDLADARALAMAYAAPAAYLATPASGSATGRNYNGLAVAATTSTGTNASASDGLIVLSDFNSNGNVVTDANDASFATTPVERADVRYFLYGATVDTSSYVNADTGATVTNPSAQQRREDGVRFGKMKKNAALATFNAELDLLATQGVITSSQAAALRFKPLDVNGDEIENFYDAKLVKLAQGKSVTSLDDQLAFMVGGTKLINSQVIVGGTQRATTHMISLIDVELNDDELINAADLDLVLAKVRGDFNLDGNVNNQDISGFVSALTDGASFVAGVADMVLDDLPLIGDFTGDSAFNNQDIAGFVARLTGGRPLADLAGDPTYAPLVAMVPEPAALSLLALGAAGLLRRRTRRAVH
jgi:hypothetical protein